MSPPLPRFHRHQEAARDRQHLTKVLAETGAEETPVTAGAGMHMDTMRLRGIPVVGGACGTSPGTDPHQAYIHTWEPGRNP